MLVTREQQLAAFREYVMKPFGLRMLAHLTVAYPEKTSAIGGVELRALVFRGIQEADAYNPKTERTTQRWTFSPDSSRPMGAFGDGGSARGSEVGRSGPTLTELACESGRTMPTCPRRVRPSLSASRRASCWLVNPASCPKHKIRTRSDAGDLGRRRDRNMPADSRSATPTPGRSASHQAGHPPQGPLRCLWLCREY